MSDPSPASAHLSVLLSQLPPGLLSTLKALRSLPKLEQALQDYLEAERGSEADDALLSAAQPLLLDGGAGKKSAAEIIEKWKKCRNVPVENAKAQAVSHRTKSGEAPGDLHPDHVGGTTSSSSRSTAPPTSTRRRLRDKRERPAPALAPAPAAAPSTSECSPLETLNSSLDVPPISATSQESRFHADAIDTATKEIDLPGVTIAIGERELLQNAHLRIKEGVHYGLVGRNGSGKSSLLRALADRLIPGLPTNLKILLVSQLETDLLAADGAQGAAKTVLQVVMDSDRARARAEREMQVLSAALDSGREEDMRSAAQEVHLGRVQDELDEARRIALRRSGARGADARKALVAAERKYQEAAEDLEKLRSTERDWQADAAELFSQVQSLLEALDASATEPRARLILRGLGFPDTLMSAAYTSLSGGWKSRVSLASALLQPADILLLDEPVNYLDLPAVIWLQRFVNELDHSVVVVSHDRAFLDAVAGELIVLRKEKLAYSDGNLTEYEKQQRRQLKHRRKQQEALDRKKEHIEKSITEGMRAAKKSGDENKMRMIVSRKKKLEDRWGLEESASGHRFKLNRDLAGYHTTSRGGIDIDTPDSLIHFTFPNPSPLRFPGALVHLDDVSFTHPGASGAVLRNVHLNLGPGDRVALVGPNGHGKTTLVNLITGHLNPSTGTITRHPRSKIGHYTQDSVSSLSQVRGNPTALSHFVSHFSPSLSTSSPSSPSSFRASATGPRVTENEARAFLGQLGLKSRTADTLPISQLSGGQKVRLGLALVMWDAPDLVILDEVTTHLDADTIEALISSLRTYRGAILLVSHDRHAVKRIIEGVSLSSIRSSLGGGGGASSASSLSEEEEDGEGEDVEIGNGMGNGNGNAVKRLRSVFLVRNAKVRLLKEGMDGYERMVEREL